MKRTLNAVTLLLLFINIAGCATSADSIPEGETTNPIISASYSAADRMLTDSVKREILGDDRRVLVASWVDVNNTNRTSVFGKMMAEQFASRLVQLGVPVVEVKLRTNLFMSEKSGEMLLSREIKEISQVHNASAVVVGTYADAGSSGVYVTVKLVRSTDARVLSATNFKVDRKLVGSIVQQ